jgi:hypothetical protein
MSLSKCDGTSCPVKHKCQRFLQTPLVKYQSYLCMIIACKDMDEDGCKFFIESEEKENELV